MSRNQSPNVVAGGNIAVASFVKQSTAADNTGLQCTSGAGAIGISGEGPRDAPGLSGSSALAAYTAGQQLQLFGLGDICNLTCGTVAITHGDEIMSDTNGLGITATTGNYVNAIALESIPANAHGRVQIVRYKI